MTIKMPSSYLCVVFNINLLGKFKELILVEAPGHNGNKMVMVMHISHSPMAVYNPSVG